MSTVRHGLTILICTHNRADLLERVLVSLNAATRPAIPVEILVAANACTDDTVTRLDKYQARQVEKGWIPLRVLNAPTPGKSHALNLAIPHIETELTAFVDDDHRVSENYLVAIEHATQTWPDASLYCGRIIPDWDGSEPPWVHDEGPYKIYPLPVPRYDFGDTPSPLDTHVHSIPGGGNLVLRHRVFTTTGNFSTELGPQGHDLGGGEDNEYVERALSRGIQCHYCPAIVQYHYVDTERLKLGYLLRKSYQRTRSTSRLRGNNGSVPLYMWRKLAEYALQGMFCLSWAKRRFFMMRIAATIGEIQGHRESGYLRKDLPLPENRQTVLPKVLAGMSAASATTAWFSSGPDKWAILEPVIAVAGICTILLLLKSLRDFSQTGPQIKQEIITHYRTYTILSTLRLTAWAFAIMAFSAGAGVAIYELLRCTTGADWSSGNVHIAALLGILCSAAFQFIKKLRLNPGLLVASSHYRMSRFYALWRKVTPFRLRMIESMVGFGTAGLVAASLARLGGTGQTSEMLTLSTLAVFFVTTIAWAAWEPEAKPHRASSTGTRSNKKPNIIMIGSDTLRADRLGAMGYSRQLTPHIDKLGTEGALFNNCFTTCARTAPSLISMLTGTWPHTHGIRDNFVAIDQTQLRVDTLPQLLKQTGYQTLAISDWCGADLGKFSFGFDYTDVPGDQWNVKYLIRQGPKDLRLFLSLFTHNRLGRTLIPELYYLGGVPQTTPMGKRVRNLISQLADTQQPFFLNAFYSTTHPPFASEAPAYEAFSSPQYDGESKFAMARLSDPFDIIRRQGSPKEEFDLNQIIDLYDGCVSAFDDEVGKLVKHITDCGLADETIIVVYSDHGMEFFEHDTWGQGNSVVGDHSSRIPLVIHDPRKSPSGTVTDVVRSIDIAPTLLELTGTPPSSTVEGLSLAPSLDGAAPTPSLCAFTETGIWLTDLPGQPTEHLRYPDLFELLEVPDKNTATLGIKPNYQDIVIQAKDRMLRCGRWKLVYRPLNNGHILQLFDVESDRLCNNDVGEGHPEIVTDLWDKLRGMIEHD